MVPELDEIGELRFETVLVARLMVPALLEFPPADNAVARPLKRQRAREVHGKRRRLDIQSKVPILGSISVELPLEPPSVSELILALVLSVT